MSTAPSFNRSVQNSVVPNLSVLPKLPPVSNNLFRWAGDLALLSHFLTRFWTHFKDYPALSALSFLRDCVPVGYHTEVDDVDNLHQALSNLSIWVEDSEIHSKKIYTSLRNISESSNLYGDHAVLKEQIRLIKKGMQISGSFWLTLNQASTHFSKYSDATAYEKLHQQLVNVAISRGDARGRANYAPTLLQILRGQRRFVNEKILCCEINQLGYKGKPPLACPLQF